MTHKGNPIRVFAAVELPPEIKTAIAEAAGKLVEEKIPLNPVSKNNLHLTLNFMGMTGPLELVKIKNILSRHASDSRSLSLSFKGAGAFPSGERPSILWVGAVDENGGLSALAEKIEKSLSETKPTRAKRGYHPHVTVARLKKKPGVSESEKIRTWLRDNRNSEFGSMEVRRLCLFQSRLSSQGASYSLLAEFNIPAKRP